MEKADKIIQFKRKAPMIIKQKISLYEFPADEMTLPSSTQKSKYFSRESDILLICIIDQMGYGNWREIKQAIRRDARARFDHLFLSRSEIDLQRRADILIKALEKEESDKVVVKKPTFEEVANQLTQALEELRVADVKMLADQEEQKALRRSQARVNAAASRRQNFLNQATSRALNQGLKQEAADFPQSEPKDGLSKEVEDERTLSDEGELDVEV